MVPNAEILLECANMLLLKKQEHKQKRVLVPKLCEYMVIYVICK